jgi:uncharacterized membrane protein YphA (DoxX/SURF4 family)
MCQLCKFSSGQDWGLLALRLSTGAVFIYHGVQKWALWSAASAMPMAGTMKFLSIVEPLGGLALILGFLSRWAALGLAIIMLGAIYTKINVWGLGFAGQQGAGWEFDLVLLASSLMLMLAGPGKWGLDRFVCRQDSTPKV